MIRRRHQPKTSGQNAAITESPQAAFARHRRTQLGREVLRYNDHVPEFPSPTFLDRFVDFPFDIAARFADLNIEANPFCVMKTLHSGFHDSYPKNRDNVRSRRSTHAPIAPEYSHA